ncbi:hypothetical protein D3C75_1058440 [compost metagenome]
MCRTADSKALGFVYQGAAKPQPAQTFEHQEIRGNNNGIIPVRIEHCFDIGIPGSNKHRKSRHMLHARTRHDIKNMTLNTAALKILAPQLVQRLYPAARYIKRKQNLHAYPP